MKWTHHFWGFPYWALNTLEFYTTRWLVGFYWFIWRWCLFSFFLFFFGPLTSATAAQLPKKNTLHRTSTAPFWRVSVLFFPLITSPSTILRWERVLMGVDVLLADESLYYWIVFLGKNQEGMRKEMFWHFQTSRNFVGSCFPYLFHLSIDLSSVVFIFIFFGFLWISIIHINIYI